MDPYASFLRQLFRLAGELWFQRVNEELWKFSEPFYNWLSELFEHPYQGWQEALDEFLAEQEAEGRILAPESRRSIEAYIESHFARTQTQSELFPYLGRGGRHPSNVNLFFSLPPGTGFTDEDLILAYEIALATSQLRRAIAESQRRLDDPGFLERINPLAASGLDQLYEIAQMGAALSELELVYTLLGYDQISWSRFDRSPESGLAGAESHVPFAGPPHGIRPETIETLMAAWGAASLAALGGKLLAKGLARLATRAPLRGARSAEEVVDDIVIDRYASLSRASELPGQAHHLNQTAAFRRVIPPDEGASIKLEGNILQDAAAPHTRAHRSLELFWSTYRGTDIVPTNSAYTRALQESLRAAGLSEAQVAKAVRAAIRERVQYGLLGGRKIPRVPNAIRNLAE